MIQAATRFRLGQGRQVVPSAFRRYQSGVQEHSAWSSFEKFADLVSRGFKVVHVSDSRELDPKHLDAEKITKFVVKPVDAFPFDENAMEVWSLPPGRGYSWPVMRTVKLGSSPGSNLIFRRIDQASLGRETETMKYLLNNSGAIWVGLPGIGKSTAAQVMLTHALRMVQRQADGDSETDKFEDLDIFGDGKTQGFGELYYRDDGHSGARVVRKGKKFEVKDLSMEEWDQTLSFNSAEPCPPERKRVVIVDIPEMEVDPVIKGLYAGTSSRSAYDTTFKTLARSHFPFFLLEPPPYDVMVTMYRAIKQLDGEDIPSEIGKEEDFIKALYDIGPIPRNLFIHSVNQATGLRGRRTKFSGYRSWVSNQAELRVLDAFEVGYHMQTIIAPFLRRGVTIPKIGKSYETQAEEYLQTLTAEQRAQVLGHDRDRIYDFRAHSMTKQLFIDKHISQPEDVQFFIENGRPTELLEATVRCAGTYNHDTTHALTTVASDNERALDLNLTDMIEEESRFDNWKWYNGEYGDHLLCTQMALKSRPHRPHDHPMCDREIFFDPTPVHSAYNGPHKVWQMKPHVLYRPSPHHPFSEIEYFFVDHARRLVVAHMVTVASLRDHPLSIDALDETMTNLGLFEDEGRQYSLLIVGVNDQTVTQPTGLVFKRKQQGTMKEEDAKGLAAWRRDGSWEHAHRVKAAVALVSVFNYAEHTVPSIPSSKKLFDVVDVANQQAVVQVVAPTAVPRRGSEVPLKKEDLDRLLLAAEEERRLILQQRATKVLVAFAKEFMGMAADPQLVWMEKNHRKDVLIPKLLKKLITKVDVDGQQPVLKTDQLVAPTDGRRKGSEVLLGQQDLDRLLLATEEERRLMLKQRATKVLVAFAKEFMGMAGDPRLVWMEKNHRKDKLIPKLLKELINRAGKK